MTSQPQNILMSSVGFFADAYDLFAVDMVLVLLRLRGLEPGSHARGVQALSIADESLIASSMVAGAVVGQIGFGVAGDLLGRRGAFLATCVLMLIGTVGSSLSGLIFDRHLVVELVFWRLLLGIGVGGEYPLAASIAAEGAMHEADKRRNGRDDVHGDGDGTAMSRFAEHFARLSPERAVATVFCCQGIGMLASPLVALALIHWSPLNLDLTWRLIVLAGALPTASLIHLRVHFRETTEFERDVLATPADREPLDAQLPLTGGAASAATKSTSDMPARSRRVLRTLRPHMAIVFSMCACWLLLDIVFYGTGCFKAVIGEALVGPAAFGAPSSGAHTGAHEGHAGRSMAAVGETVSAASSVEVWADADALLSRNLAGEGNSGGSSGSSYSPRAHASRRAQYGLIVGLVALPGYLVAQASVDKVGVYRMQTWGFAAMTVLFVAIAGALAAGLSRMDAGASDGSSGAREAFIAGSRGGLRHSGSAGEVVVADAASRGLSSAATPSTSSRPAVEGGGSLSQMLNAMQSVEADEAYIQSASARRHADHQLLASESDVGEGAEPGAHPSLSLLQLTDASSARRLAHPTVGSVNVSGEQRAALSAWRNLLLLLLFSLTFFFSNFGPNTTTFIYPTVAVPTAARATAHGIAAASGKIGAVIGTAMFAPVVALHGYATMFAMCAAVCAAGWLLSRPPPSKPAE